MAAAVKLSRAEVEAALAVHGLYTFRTLDSEYWAVSEEYWNLVVENTAPYRPWFWDDHDCDDLAMEFVVDVRRNYHITAGIVVNRIHAFNVIILPDLGLRFIDAGWSTGPVFVTPDTSDPDTFHSILGARVWV